MSDGINPNFDAESQVSTECDECGAAIPDDERSNVNASHDESCSLHPANTVEAPASAAEPSEPAIVCHLDNMRALLNAHGALLRAVLDAMEAAIDAHPGLTRAWKTAQRPNGEPHTAEAGYGRLGWDVSITATGIKPRGRTGTRINGRGETLDVAVCAFLDSLDAWAEVLK